MDASRLRRLQREKQNDLTVVRDHKRHIVVSPTVTRRPQLDAMLGMTSMIAMHELEAMRDKILDTGSRLDREERKTFQQICEAVIKQTRLEMEVERHVEQRMSGMDDKELASLIAQELTDLLRGRVAPDSVQPIVEGLLDALGLA